MAQDKPEPHIMFAYPFLMMIFAGLTLFVFSIARANLGPDSAASIATFRTKCALCHGPDGRGSAVGRSMNVPDLRSPEVQKLPDAQLTQFISDGKGGMPSFKSSLSEDQIHGLVTYIHSLHRPVVMLRGREGTL
jgi:mono/diheme cytochrome c family protein